MPLRERRTPERAIPMNILLRTADVSETERVDFWRSAMKSVLSADCAVRPVGRSFEAAMGVLDCDPINLVEISGQAFETRRMGPGAEGWVSLMFQIDGMGAMSDGKRECLLCAGDMCIVAPDRDITARRPGRFRQVLANVPRDELDAALPAWQSLSMTTISADRPATKAAADVIRLMMGRRDLLDRDCRGHLAAVALNLIGGLTAEAAAPGRASRPTRMMAYHRRRIEAFVLENLRDPELSVSGIAAALGLSVRYVHRLFHADGSSLMQWVMQQRLQACRREIDARCGRSISEVAFAWGFNCASHFSRAFKKQFGVRPSEI